MSRANPLFYKMDGSLDLSQFILCVLTVYVCTVFVLAGTGTLRVSTAAWAFLGSFTTLAFIAWAARDRAALIAGAREGSLPSVSLPVSPDSSEPNVYTDDERGDFPGRERLP
jgi:hypothetical protein